jgi:DNA helicase-2/ATP-dependent DNA helicase PcrA
LPARPQTDATLAGDALTAAERAVIAEEEALLARVLAALAARRSTRDDQPELESRLRELREEAQELTAKDLPTVFQEMGLVRAVMERSRGGEPPDPAAPYFAHLRLREGKEVRDYFLGRATFFEREAGVRVVDWREAPVASLFYRYREGEEYEEPFPGRVARGRVESRRVVVIDRGRLVRISASSASLVRGPQGWRRAAGSGARLGGGAGTAARAGMLGIGAGALGRTAEAAVTALLDREQWEAVSAPASEPLLVLGSAGSGKTTVALHRLARIATSDPRTFPPSRIQVVVPEPGLARLAARLLAPLGLEKVAVRTLDDWARGAFQSAFATPPPRLCAEPPALVSRLKRHPALYQRLREQARPTGAITLRSLRRDLGDLLVDPAFVASVVEVAQRDLPTTAVEEVVRHTRLQLAEPASVALAGIDPERLATIDGLAVDEDTPESLAGSLDAEDLPLLLFLAGQGGGPTARRLAHLVVDEAEDVSLVELSVLGRHLDGARSVTLAGDEAQQTFSSYAGWPQALEALGIAGAATVRLATTYRCPAPVAELAHQVLGPLAPPEPPQAGKAGAPVARFDFPGEAHAQLFLTGAIRDLLEREPEASVAVIAASAETARGLHRLLADLPEARLSLDGRFTFRPGVDVTDVASVKGLEFDYVVIPDASIRAYPDEPEARRRLHVAVTRAAHQLWIAATGTPSPLLASLRVT